MKIRVAVLASVIGIACVQVGCIHHEETVYRDGARTNVEFENDKAARLFYETLNERSSKGAQSESKTEVDLPLVFHNKRRVVSGPNAAFNRAVDICDANHDGRITELEASIYSEHGR